jgi:hypothetical protein
MKQSPKFSKSFEDPQSGVLHYTLEIGRLLSTVLVVASGNPVWLRRSESIFDVADLSDYTN